MAAKTKKMKKQIQKILLFVSIVMLTSCISPPPVVSIPTVTTASTSVITSTSAVSGGNVTSTGELYLDSRGVVWSTSTNPTVALSTKTTDGTASGIFASTITGLVANTTYYVRAYATNSIGTAYGNEESFTTSAYLDNDGNTLATVVIGTQEWMQKNLDETKYRNGDVIPQVTDPTAWAGLTTGAWCYYANNTANGTVYGKLYNWYAVTDPRGLAPIGWHVPNNNEWTTLTDYLGGTTVAGGKIKSTLIWNSPNIGATNSSGFTALPGGNRYYDGVFNNIGYDGYWWSATEVTGTSNAWILSIDYNYAYTNSYSNFKADGISVRCVKD